MKPKMNFIKLDSQWTLLHQSITAQEIGVGEEVFERFIEPALPKFYCFGCIYYSSFDINWRVNQLCRLLISGT